MCEVASCNVELAMYFICGIRSLFLLRICDSFLSIFKVGSFFTIAIANQVR